MDSIEKPTFYINSDRFKYLLVMYNLNYEQFLTLLNGERKKSVYTQQQLKDFLDNKAKVDEPFLKRFDKIFESGLTWVISNRPLPDKTKMSIFFRKDTFNSELNLESRKKIAQFEELKTEISIMTKQIGFKSERKLKQFTCEDNPKSVALEIREEFDKAMLYLIKENELKKHREEKDFLKNIISVCEYFNIFVFEFIDRSRTPGNDIRFNGFYTHPNIIAIKRNQNYMKREIFTLAHELAHYLINAEEIDEVIESFVKGKTERWCNDFAFHFLDYENWDVLKEPCPALDRQPIKSKYFEEIVKLSYDQGNINEIQVRKYLNSKNYSFDFNLN